MSFLEITSKGLHAMSWGLPHYTMSYFTVHLPKPSSMDGCNTVDHTNKFTCMVQTLVAKKVVGLKAELTKYAVWK